MASNNDPLCALLVISLLPLWNATVARARELNGAACSLDSGIDTKPPPVLSVHASLRELYKLSQSLKTLKVSREPGLQRENRKTAWETGGLSPILVLFVTRVFSRPPTLFGTFHFGRPTDEATERPTTESDFPCRNSSDPFSVQSDRVTVDRHRSIKRLAVCPL